MTVKIAARGPWWEFAKLISVREPFNTHGELRGVEVDPRAVVAYGQLPNAYQQELFYGRPDYIVYSYETPIAWHDSVTGEWTKPDVKYSRTTSAHQTKIFTAIDNQR